MGSFMSRSCKMNFKKASLTYNKTKDDIIFQQDNDSKHTCHKARNWFQDHDFNVILWPAHSPDLNPIEHLWNHLKRRLAGYEEEAKGMLELWNRVQVGWDKMEPEVCQNLIESMPRRTLQRSSILPKDDGHPLS